MVENSCDNIKSPGLSADDALLAKPAELEPTDLHCSLSVAAAAGVYSVSSTSTVAIGTTSGGASRCLLMGKFGDMLSRLLRGANRALHVNGWKSL